MEALLRWRHPELGDVPPQEFVPLAEESPLITQLGRWVLHEACRTVARTTDDELSVAVNVSARQVRSGELVSDVVSALEAGGLPPSRLIVEITESMLLDAHVAADLETLRGLGVRVAVDDFRTGWSSLAYLAGMPVDVLKMDQHFLAGVEENAQRRALCRAVLQLGSSLGLPVIVEGVATPPASSRCCATWATASCRATRSPARWRPLSSPPVPGAPSTPPQSHPPPPADPADGGDAAVTIR